jgi:transcription antitermination factor NusG
MATSHDASMGDWFAVQVWSGREHLSARHLAQRGYEVFLPHYREQRRWSDRLKVVERALFAGYVFCRFSPEIVGRIVTAPGVLRIVGDGTGPSPIPLHEIEAIQRIVAARLAAEPSGVPRAGQRVRIEDGPLRGIDGIVQVVKNQQRLVVAVSLLQRAVSVEIDPRWISVSAPSADCEARAARGCPEEATPDARRIHPASASGYAARGR